MRARRPRPAKTGRADAPVPAAPAPTPADSPASVAPIHFAFRPDNATTSVHVAGDFNDWSTESHPMWVAGDRLKAVIPLPAGQAHRYRFLVDGERWEHDPFADAYLPRDDGGHDSVIDLSGRTDPSLKGAAALLPDPTADRELRTRFESLVGKKLPGV